VVASLVVVELDDTVALGYCPSSDELDIVIELV
jgi:hypothetical protein